MSSYTNHKTIDPAKVFQIVGYNSDLSKFSR